MYCVSNTSYVPVPLFTIKVSIDQSLQEVKMCQNIENTIFSPGTSRLYLQATLLVYYLGVAPYKWKTLSESKQIKIFTYPLSPFYQIYKIFSFTAVSFHVGFLLTKLILALHRLDSMQLIIQLFWNMSCYSSPWIAQIQIYQQWEEIPNLINGFIAYFTRIPSKYINICPIYAVVSIIISVMIIFLRNIHRK